MSSTYIQISATNVYKENIPQLKTSEQRELKSTYSKKLAQPTLRLQQRFCIFAANTKQIDFSIASA